ncbi:transmembrane protein, putative [Medicago truncatula]|uniref:Transmembrane protein, putative n=1 Tax=Medicago truncatula TaxID=3880 RepID=G7LBB1_MEDTR|nr:transmembrane protein, putative [Medicago truncatula]
MGKQNYIGSFLIAQLSANASPSRLIILLRNSWIVRRFKDRNGLWLSSRGLGCAPVYLGGGLAGWLLVGRVFGQVKVFALVVRELRGAFLTYVGSLVGQSLLIQGQEQVCDSGPFRLL